MKRNKKLLVAAAAGALTVAAAVPAFALENEFHGSFTAFYDLSNFSAVGNDGFEQFNAAGNGPGTGNATGLRRIENGVDVGKAKTENYFVQRARLGYTAKASDSAKLVTAFELDYSFWGNSNFTIGRNTGGGIGADSVNLETKSVYLDLKSSMVNAKIGMQPYNDSFKGILFDDDMAGVLLSHDYTNASVSAGYFRFLGDALGKNTWDMISLDGKYDISKNFKVGAAYYYIKDNRSNGSTSTTVASNPPSAFVDGAGNPIYPAGTTFTTTTTANAPNDVKIHTLGLNAEGVIGPVTLNGFAMAQFGDISDVVNGNQSVTRAAHGYALNLGAKAPVFGGTLRSEFLYVAGGKNAWYVPANQNSGTSGGAFYDGEMIMLLRDKNAKTIDQALIFDVNNYNQGVILGTIGYDHACTDKITSSINAGFAAIAKDVGVATAPRHNSNYIGTELNLESNYKLNANTTLGIRGGYVFLGDYFRGLNADNPYDMKIIASYAF
ncbi:histidine kinase [Geomonas silvestris]|uniref:Histidine kinase n=1 Tax=Geomonas silvestris TaxID=2740184 RepID=A0A6V8MN24_9BACT|nr:porin [Geomonas silvestris]GFO61410.1 histidine kinase [Geomonas silvestris]